MSIGPLSVNNNNNNKMQGLQISQDGFDMSLCVYSVFFFVFRRAPHDVNELFVGECHTPQCYAFEELCDETLQRLCGDTFGVSIVFLLLPRVP